MTAIERVHGDGILPTIEVRRAVLPGGYDGYYHAFPPYAIVVSEGAPDPTLTVLHESAHVLDHHGLGAADDFASATDPSLDGWRTVVRASQAVAELERAARTAPTADEVAYLLYLLDDGELWARSYLQYVVRRSGDAVLGDRLDKLRQRPSGLRALYTPEQWDDDDFAPVAREIDRLFRRLGWNT